MPRPNCGYRRYAGQIPAMIHFFQVDYNPLTTSSKEGQPRLQAPLTGLGQTKRTGTALLVKKRRLAMTSCFQTKVEHIPGNFV